MKVHKMTPPDFSSDAEKYEAVNQPSTHTFSGALYMPGSLRQAYLAGASRGYEVGQGERDEEIQLLTKYHRTKEDVELINKLCMRLEDAEQALKFYADKKSYGSDDVSRSTGNECFDIVLFDFERGKKRDYAGKRARAYFSKHSADGGGVK